MKYKKYVVIVALVLSFISLHVLQANATDSRYLASNWQEYVNKTASSELGFSLSPNTIGCNCFGLASLVTMKLNNVVVKAYDYDMRKLASSSGYIYGIGPLSGKSGSEVKTVVASYLDNGNYITTDDVKAAFSNARVGDWVQMVVSRQHSAIISELYTDGFEVLQSNWPSGTINNKFFSYEEFAQLCKNRGYDGGFTINRFGNGAPSPTNLTFTGNTDTFADESYTATCSASGSNVTYSIVYENVTTSGNTVNGILPSGLTLNSSTGKITGKATNIAYTGDPNARFRYYPITYNFTVRASNSGGYTDKRCSINVWEAPRFSQYTPPAGTLGAEYEYAIVASGTETGMQWLRQQNPNLPNGLAFDFTTANKSESRIVNIKGTPTKPGTYTFTLSLQNTKYTVLYGTKRIQKEFTINVPEPEIYCTNMDTLTEVTSLPRLYAGTAVSNLKFSVRNFSGSGSYTIEGSLPPGLSMSSTGKLTGTPSFTYTKPIAFNTYNFNVVAKLSRNSLTYTVKKSYTLTVTEKPTFSTNTLTSGTVGQQYNATIDVTGSGAGMEIFLKSGSSLPSGLKLENGSNKWQKKITGIPSSSGTYRFTLTARNDVASSQTTTTKEFTITIANKPVVKPTINYTFMNGTVGKYYSDYITASGGTSPYTWTKTSGTLPPDLSLSPSGSTCYLKGTPKTAGTYTFYLQAKDAYGNTSDPKRFTVVINSAPTINNGTFKNATVGQSYSGSVSVTGGTAPYSWTISGNVPANLSPSSSGTTYYLRGTLTKADTYNFTVKVTDANKLTATKSFTMRVYPALSLSGTFANTNLGQSYSKTLTISGGASPYTASYSGNIPAGITPSKSGSSIKFSGKPTKSGTSSFKVTVTDDNGAKLTKSYTITTIAKLAASGSFTNYGTLNKSYSSSITVSGGTPNYTSSYTGTLPKGLKFKKSPTGSTITLSGKPTKTGTYSFKLTIKDKAGTKLTTKSFTVKISNPLQVSGSFRSTGKLNQSYSASSIKISGGVSPYKYARTGSLPTGMSLSLSGSTLKLYGTPKTSGKKTFTLKITDKDGRAVSKTFALTISQTTKTASVAAETTAQPTSEKGITGDKVATIAIPNLGSIAHEDELGADEPEIEIEEEVVAGHSKPVVKVGLQVFAVSDENILETGTERDEDLVKVRAGNPVTFEIVDVDFEKIAPEKFTVLYDFEPVENDDIIIEEDGSFTLPAELVTGDFAISVKAEDENYEYESGELFIEAVSDQASEAEE